MLLICSIIFIPTLNKQVRGALDRYETLSLLAKGDLTAGGTLSRLTERKPKLMKAYSESSVILGDGFSNSYFEHNDCHIGYHNLLLNTGIFGVGIFAFFYFSSFYKMLSAQKDLISVYPKAKGFRILLSGLLGMMIINTGVQVIGFEISFQAYFTTALLLIASDIMIKEGYGVRKQLIQNKFK